MYHTFTVLCIHLQVNCAYVHVQYRLGVLWLTGNQLIVSRGKFNTK